VGGLTATLDSEGNVSFGAAANVIIPGIIEVGVGFDITVNPLKPAKKYTGEVEKEMYDSVIR